MIYGLISGADGQTTVAVFKGKKIPKENMVSNYELENLVQRLKAGDVVYVISVDRFASVNQVLALARWCHEKLKANLSPVTVI